MIHPCGIKQPESQQHACARARDYSTTSIGTSGVLSSFSSAAVAVVVALRAAFSFSMAAIRLASITWRCSSLRAATAPAASGPLATGAGPTELGATTGCICASCCQFGLPFPLGVVAIG